jgi:hypothetical protein
MVLLLRVNVGATPVPKSTRSGGGTANRLAIGDLQIIPVSLEGFPADEPLSKILTQVSKSLTVLSIFLTPLVGGFFVTPLGSLDAS